MVQVVNHRKNFILLTIYSIEVVAVNTGGIAVYIAAIYVIKRSILFMQYLKILFVGYIIVVPS